MPSNYPDAYDVFPIPGQSNKVSEPGVKHSELHRDLGLSIEALQATLGLNPEGAFSNVVSRLVFLESLALSGDSIIVLEGLEDHLQDTSDAHDASAISFSPTGSISSTNVQAAIAELISEIGTGLNFYSETATDANIETPTGSVTITSENGFEVYVNAGSVDIYSDVPGNFAFFGASGDVIIRSDNGDTYLRNLALDKNVYIEVPNNTDQTKGIVFSGDRLLKVGSVSHETSVIAASGTTETINCLDFSCFDITLDANCVITIAGVPATNQDCTIKAIIRGDHAVSFTAADGVLWPDGVMPLHDGVLSVYYLTYDKVATQWLGYQAATNFF
jgi:hypothetical protein